MSDELGMLFKSQINSLAANFYHMGGRKLMQGYDFSKSVHPEEYGCWNKAVVAYAFIGDDKELLKHQVTNKIKF